MLARRNGFKNRLVSNFRLVCAMLVFILMAIGSTVQAGQWKSVTGVNKLKALYSDTRMEGPLTKTAKWRTEYCTDGTGIQWAWGVTFARTWRVRGDNQVCITSEADGKTYCYTYEQNVDKPNEYRAKNVLTFEAWVFNILEEKPKSCPTPVVTEKAPDVTKAPVKEKTAGPSAAEMAKKLANPSLAIGQMTSNFTVTSFRGELPGANNQDSFVYQFQPTLPFPLEDGKAIMLRPAISLLFDQPSFNATSNSFEEVGVELGDIPFDLVYGGTSKSGFILSYGVAGTLPTATDDRVGKDQWLLGPEILIGQTYKWGLLGLLVNHQWDIGGSNKEDTSITAGQYFYGINIGDGVFITSGPAFSYNHEATSGSKTTFPIGFGVSKTTALGGKIWKFQAQYFYYTEQPDTFGPQHQLKFSITPVVELPWSK